MSEHESTILFHQECIFTKKALECVKFRSGFSRAPNQSGFWAPFPALRTGYMFSRPWHWLHVFPRFTTVIRYSALAYGYMFPCAWKRFYVFPRLEANYMFLVPVLFGYNSNVCRDDCL